MLDHRIRHARTVVAVTVPLSLPLAVASASHLAEAPRKRRIVYPLDDAGVDKAKFALGNLQNHIRRSASGSGER